MVLPQAKAKHDNAPILMWDPVADKLPAMCKLWPPDKLLASLIPAVVEDIIDKFNAPPQPILVRRTTRS